MNMLLERDPHNRIKAIDIQKILCNSDPMSEKPISDPTQEIKTLRDENLRLQKKIELINIDLNKALDNKA